MRIALYEFITGGGWASDPPLPASLAAEGQAMLRALAEDLVAIDGVSLDVLIDPRHGSLDLAGCKPHVVSNGEDIAALARLATTADWTIVIAPEFDGHLLARCRAVEAAGGRLLGAHSTIIALAGDKHATAEHLARHGVRVPRGIALVPRESLPEDFEYPAVLKPRDGAGSLGIEVLSAHQSGLRNGPAPARLEEFRAGRAASVALLCGPAQMVPLTPCWQRLAGETDLRYLGGTLPMPVPLAKRATRLATDAIRTLDGPLGYLGVDLVLGDDDAGADDVVIEINPRLTTSYVGLRALAKTNLAAALVDVARGNPLELCWHERSIQFDATGAVREDSTR